MIADLNETLKHLLIETGELDPAKVQFTFVRPAAEPDKPQPGAGINFYLYDIRENLELRETQWDTQMEGTRKVRIKRRPLRMDLRYNITCWASTVEDQNRLLWSVLETLLRNSPIPDDLLQGDLRQLLHPVITQVAQPDGAVSSPSDTGASISLLATLDLDLNQETTTPLVFARGLKLSQLLAEPEPATGQDESSQNQPKWEAAPVRFGGLVHTASGQPVEGVSVRLLSAQTGGGAVQFGPTIHTNEVGHYVFHTVPPGQYTLVVEVSGQAPQQRPLTIALKERGELLPALAHEVEVAMAKT